MGRQPPTPGTAARGLPLMLSDGTNSYVTGADGLPLEQITGSSVTYLYQDQLGSTRGLLDGSGTLVGTYTYGPFGDVRSHTGTATTPFGYAGQYTDGESGLQYLRARYYDPSSAQFLTVDPLVGETGQSYAYVDDAPLNATDYSGLCGVGPVSLPCPSDVTAFAGQVFASATGLTPAYAPPAQDTSRFFACAPSSYTTGRSNVVAAAMLFLLPSGEGGDAVRLGDLSLSEIEQIQSVVEEVGRPLWVVGSAARGARRAGSDIDYTTGGASVQGFVRAEGRLPGRVGPHGVLEGTHDPFTGPAIRFEPGQPPRMEPAP